MGLNLPFLFTLPLLIASLARLLLVSEYIDSGATDDKNVIYLCMSIVYFHREENYKVPKTVLTQRRCTENIYFSFDFLLK